MWPFGNNSALLGVVELIRTRTDNAGLAVLPDDLLRRRHLDHPLVRLVGDEDITVGEEGVLDWRG